jgi:hypothetical protein
LVKIKLWIGEKIREIMGLIIILALLFPSKALAHHGGVSLPFGPGAPIETAIPLTLPEGGLVLSTKVEQVEWRKFQFAEPTNKDSLTFLDLGLSCGQGAASFAEPCSGCIL